MKPLFTRAGAMQFLEQTVVHSLEGWLFALVSALLTLAGANAFIEGAIRPADNAAMVASAPAPAAPPTAQPTLLQVAAAQRVSSVADGALK
jgi:zona occludens toxin (predicted ATPase)